MQKNNAEFIQHIKYKMYFMYGQSLLMWNTQKKGSNFYRSVMKNEKKERNGGGGGS